MKKRIFGLAAATAFTVTALAAPALAFEPPADPAGNFNGGSPAGHPGAIGQAQAVTANGTRGAWSAHDNSDQIDN